MTAAPKALTLGDLLAGARAQSAGFAAWLDEGDPLLMAALEAALQPGESLVGRVRAAIADFAADATASEWATLVSATRDAEDPGLAALAHMLRWSLAMAAPR